MALVFMDHYDPLTVFSSIDHQEGILCQSTYNSQWNLARLAETILHNSDKHENALN